jgi:hypothetical protein
MVWLIIIGLQNLTQVTYQRKIVRARRETSFFRNFVFLEKKQENGEEENYEYE